MKDNGLENLTIVQHYTTVSFPVFVLACDSQLLVEGSAGAFVLPDMQIDGFMAHGLTGVMTVQTHRI